MQAPKKPTVYISHNGQWSLHNIRVYKHLHNNIRECTKDCITTSECTEDLSRTSLWSSIWQWTSQKLAHGTVIQSEYRLSALIAFWTGQRGTLKQELHLCESNSKNSEQKECSGTTLLKCTHLGDGKLPR